MNTMYLNMMTKEQHADVLSWLDKVAAGRMESATFHGKLLALVGGRNFVPVSNHFYPQLMAALRARPAVC